MDTRCPKSGKKDFALFEIVARVKIKFRFAYGTPPVWESPFAYPTRAMTFSIL
jgi:hypothetical protein